MAFSKNLLSTVATFSLYFSLSLAFPGYNHFWSGIPSSGNLYPEFYQYSCPQANEIVMSVLKRALAKEPRMAASLLRLQFHDCFVQGCDASILLDHSKNIASEKYAVPNKSSVRGFEVIDEIKAKLEEACPETVSCADIITLAARGSTVLSGGPSWELSLRRRDSRTASLQGANANIPPPNSTLQNLVKLFERQGLDEVDLVALSGSHTIGMARCVSFKQRLYDRYENNKADKTMEKSLLNSDEVLLTGNDAKTVELVKSYAEDETLFINYFAKSIVKLGRITPLTGHSGEIRKNCRKVNGNI